MDILGGRPDPNISREKLMEDLVELRALTTGFFESIPGAIIVLDKQWNLIYLNHEAREIFMSKDDSLIGKPLEEIYPRQLSHLLAPHTIHELLKGQENTIRGYVNHFRKWFKVSAYSSDFGIFIHLEDITFQTTSNRLLMLNEFSVDNAGDMVFWFTTSGHIIYANVASCDALGFNKKELTSMIVTDINPSFTDNKRAVLVEDLKQKGSKVYETSLRASDRSMIPVEVTCNYLVYHGEEYLIAFVRDITERKRAEEELRRAHSDLEKKVEERTKELKYEKIQAELYLDLMGHDMSNMHQIIEAQLELAQELMAEKGRLEGDKKDLIDTPLQTLKRSNRLIDNVRKLQKLRAGEYKTEAIDIGRLLTEVVEEYSSVPGKDIAIDYSPIRGNIVMANPLLKDVFNNLVGNAIKHSNHSIKIWVKVDRVNEYGSPFYRIAIEDNGPGIPDSKKDEVFHRFRRGQTRVRGTGLGLYIVMTLVESFHGRVKVEDRVPGDHTKGSRFLVYLPVAEDAHEK
jgi:PAS domain S-box-containing protein